MYLFKIAEQYADHIALEVGDEKLTFEEDQKSLLTTN